MLLPLTLASVILVLLLALGGDKGHVEEYLLLPVWVRTEILAVYHALAEARSHIVQDDNNKVSVSHLGINSKSINIMQVFRYSTSLFEITDLLKSLVWLVVVTRGFSNGILVYFPSIEPMLVSFPLFQCMFLCI